MTARPRLTYLGAFFLLAGTSCLEVCSGLLNLAPGGGNEEIGKRWAVPVGGAVVRWNVCLQVNSQVLAVRYVVVWLKEKFLPLPSKVLPLFSEQVLYKERNTWLADCLAVWLVCWLTGWLIVGLSEFTNQIGSTIWETKFIPKDFDYPAVKIGLLVELVHKLTSFFLVLWCTRLVQWTDLLYINIQTRRIKIMTMIVTVKILRHEATTVLFAWWKMQVLFSCWDYLCMVSNC